MKLERLSLANYRGFQQLDIEFAPDVTVIAGINGVGKSSILESLAVLFSQGLPQFTQSIESPLGWPDIALQAQDSVHELDERRLFAASCRNT